MANNYEFKRRDKDDKDPTTDGTNEQPKEKRLKKNDSFIFKFRALFRVWFLRV